jgi:hypothetical protein
MAAGALLPRRIPRHEQEHQARRCDCEWRRGAPRRRPLLLELADAEAEYFSQRHGGTKQYAVKFLSDTGKQNLGTQRLTPCRLGALIVAAGPLRLPAEKHALKRTVVVSERKQRRVHANTSPPGGITSK